MDKKAKSNWEVLQQLHGMQPLGVKSFYYTYTPSQAELMKLKIMKNMPETELLQYVQTQLKLQENFFKTIFDHGDEKILKFCLDNVSDRLEFYLRPDLDNNDMKQMYLKSKPEKLMILIQHDKYLVNNNVLNLMNLLCEKANTELIRFAFKHFLPNCAPLIENALFDVALKNVKSEEKEKLLSFFIIERNFTPILIGSDEDVKKIVERRNLNQSLCISLPQKVSKNRFKI